MRKNQAPSPSLSSALDKIRLHFTDSVPHIREFHNAPLDTDLRGSYRQSCALRLRNCRRAELTNCAGNSFANTTWNSSIKTWVCLRFFPLRGTRLSMPVVVRFHLYRLDDGYAKGTICISLGKHNTKEEAEKIVAALAKIVGRYS